MNRRGLPSLGAALAGWLLAGVACAQSLDSSISVRGSVFSGSRRLDDAGAVARASIWGRAKLELSAAGKVVADGWAGFESGAGSSPEAQAAGGRSRELYWQAGHGPWDWKVGRQIIVWGRADGWNPTDNLTPRDFTLLAGDDNDQRRGNDAVQVSLDTGHGTFTAIGFGRSASHTLPLEALAQVLYRAEAVPRATQWALKYDLTGDGIDGSVSYFQGHDPMPDFSIAGLGPSGVIVALRNNPLRVLGADLSLTRGAVVWRAEAAFVDTDSTGRDDYSRKKPRQWLVAGAEFPLAGTLTLGLQATWQRVADYRSPDDLADSLAREIAWRQAAVSNQTGATQAGIVWRLAGRWRNDTLLAEANGVWLSQPASSLWRTRVTWALDDRLQLRAGTDHFKGPAHSLWGQLRRNDLAFVELRAGF